MYKCVLIRRRVLRRKLSYQVPEESNAREARVTILVYIYISIDDRRFHACLRERSQTFIIDVQTFTVIIITDTHTHQDKHIHTQKVFMPNNRFSKWIGENNFTVETGGPSNPFPGERSPHSLGRRPLTVKTAVPSR